VGVGENWSIVGEWDFLDFGTQTSTFTDPNLGSSQVSAKQHINELKLGINYRFGNRLPYWGISPGALRLNRRNSQICAPHKSDFVQSRDPFGGYYLAVSALHGNPLSKSVLSFNVAEGHATVALPSLKVQ
jgi:hypothetical protein